MDITHSVDAIHSGSFNNSILKIPSCPMTELNVYHLAYQRDMFPKGILPNFPSREDENRHVGKPSVEETQKAATLEGLQAF